MITLKLEQSSEEWKAHRSTARNASEASVLFGVSKNYKRIELIENKALGTEKDICDYVREVIFEEGHRVEPYARQIAEEIIGDFLDPIVCMDDDEYLSASLDGLTGDREYMFEAKQWNHKKADYIREHNEIPSEDFWQVIQGLYCSGARKCIYVVSDGTEENTVHVEYTANEAEFKTLLNMWHIADKDIENYQCSPQVEVEPGKAPSFVPSIIIDMSTIVSHSNLQDVKEQAIQVFDNIKTDLSTDQDFEDAKATAKWCRDIIVQLDDAKKRAIDSNYDARVIFEAIDEMREKSRKTALTLEKAIKSNNDAIRANFKEKAKLELLEFIRDLNFGHLISIGLKGQKVDVVADFAHAMKGKRSIKGLEEAVAVELSEAKCSAIARNEEIILCHEILEEASRGYEHLFKSDREKLLKMEKHYLEIEAKNRVNEFIQWEKEKEEKERIKKEQDEQIKKQLVEPDSIGAILIHKGNNSSEIKICSSGKEPTNHHKKNMVDEVNINELANLSAEESEKMLDESDPWVQIRKSEYDQLKHDSKFLLCLWSAGVDNWQGFEMAQEMLNKED